MPVVELRRRTTSEPSGLPAPDAPAASGGRRGESVVQALPFVIVAGLAAFMVERDGGFAVTVWYPVGLAVLAVAVTLLWSLGRRQGPSRAPRGASVLLLAAFTGWGFLTIAWAAVRGDAWDGSNRTLLYLLVFGFLAAWPTTAPRSLARAPRAQPRDRGRGRRHRRAHRPCGQPVCGS